MFTELRKKVNLDIYFNFASKAAKGRPINKINSIKKYNYLKVF